MFLRLVYWRWLLLELQCSLLGQPYLPKMTAQIQELTGTVFPGEIYYYRLDGLEAGQTVYAYVDEISGNLDPVAALMEGESDIKALERAYQDSIAAGIAEGGDPLKVRQDVASQFFLVSDDDSGPGLAATFEYAIPKDGDYGLIVAGSLGSFGFETSGQYRLLLGLDAPAVLEGTGKPTGDVVAVLDLDATPSGEKVEETTGEITIEESEVVYELTEARVGDTLSVYIEATTGDLRPALVLSNYADKPVAAANINGEATSATLQYTFDESGRNFKLRVTGCCDDQPSTGEYRLLLGTNAPDVLAGTAASTGEELIQKPVDVQIGVKLQQIIEINESSEYYNAVVSLQMEWMDPDAAFSPDTCDCTFKTYTASDFDEFLDAVGEWPEFTIFNQQGNRWSQNKVGVIFSNGRILYFERFTTNLQVDFDFTKYPFDTQEFTIKVDGVYPEEMFVLTDLPGYSEISPEHGEDEFVITDRQTKITSEQASTRSMVSRFTFSFTAPRNLDYYVLQIFIPILLIIIVSYVTFFLRDYGRRIEVASGNLLLFIAFSFSLADNYPRLGYVTFLDALMAMMFVINALVVIYNVWLRKMEMAGDGDQAQRIDNVLDWAYPLAYISALIGLYIIFFVIK